MASPDNPGYAQDRLCRCLHLLSEHADPAGGDTRCLVICDGVDDLLDSFDNGRDGMYFCACLEFVAP
jgi:hypothetical protein